MLFALIVGVVLLPPQPHRERPAVGWLVGWLLTSTILPGVVMKGLVCPSSIEKKEDTKSEHDDEKVRSNII